MGKKILALCIPLSAISTSSFAQESSFSSMMNHTNTLIQNTFNAGASAQARENSLANSLGASGASSSSNTCDALPPLDLLRANGQVPPELQGDPRYQAWLRCHQAQGTTAIGATHGNTCDPLPPLDLLRANGRVPPELQGDPRYQAWLRCRQQAAAIAQPPVSPPAGAYVPPPARHIPLPATDFDAVPGHPAVEQILQSMQLSEPERAQFRLAFNNMTDRLADSLRPHNLAQAMAWDICTALKTIDERANDTFSECNWGTAVVDRVNDRLGVLPQIAAMSNLQKQNMSDALFFQSVILLMMRGAGESNPQVKMQSIQLAHTVLLQLTGSPTGQGL